MFVKFMPSLERWTVNVLGSLGDSYQLNATNPPLTIHCPARDMALSPVGIVMVATFE